MRELRDDIFARAERRNTRFLERLAADSLAHPAIPPADLSRAVTGMVARSAELAAEEPGQAARLAEQLDQLYLRVAGITGD